MEQIFDIVPDIIEEATEKHILPHYKHLSESDISTKTSATDFVTSADIAADSYISAQLKKLLPNSIVIGEESAYNNPAIFDKVKTNNEATFWLIDPIDGTKNFVNGTDIFGTMVALVKYGQAIAGWIYLPLKNIWIKPDSVLPKLSGVKPLTSLKGTFSIKNLGEALPNHQWWGSAAYSYAMLLMGHIDYAIFQKPTLQPWDHTAGIFFYEKLGGIVSLADGRGYKPFPQAGTLILAPSGQVWDDLAQIITKVKSL